MASLASNAQRCWQAPASEPEWSDDRCCHISCGYGGSLRLYWIWMLWRCRRQWRIVQLLQHSMKLFHNYFFGRRFFCSWRVRQLWSWLHLCCRDWRRSGCSWMLSRDLPCSTALFCYSWWTTSLAEVSVRSCSWYCRTLELGRLPVGLCPFWRHEKCEQLSLAMAWKGREDVNFGQRAPAVTSKMETCCLMGHHLVAQIDFRSFISQCTAGSFSFQFGFEQGSALPAGTAASMRWRPLEHELSDLHSCCIRSLVEVYLIYEQNSRSPSFHLPSAACLLMVGADSCWYARSHLRAHTHFSFHLG